MPQIHVSKTSKVFAQLTLSGMCKHFFFHSWHSAASLLLMLHISVYIINIRIWNPEIFGLFCI